MWYRFFNLMILDVFLLWILDLSEHSIMVHRGCTRRNNKLCTSKLSEQTGSRSPPVSQGPVGTFLTAVFITGFICGQLWKRTFKPPGSSASSSKRWTSDGRMLGDLCARPPSWSPGPHIDCLFLQAAGSRESAISLDLGARIDWTPRDANAPDRDTRTRTGARLTLHIRHYWFAIACLQTSIHNRSISVTYRFTDSSFRSPRGQDQSHTHTHTMTQGHSPRCCPRTLVENRNARLLPPEGEPQIQSGRKKNNPKKQLWLRGQSQVAQKNLSVHAEYSQYALHITISFICPISSYFCCPATSCVIKRLFPREKPAATVRPDVWLHKRPYKVISPRILLGLSFLLRNTLFLYAYDWEKCLRLYFSVSKL